MKKPALSRIHLPKAVRPWVAIAVLIFGVSAAAAVVSPRVRSALGVGDGGGTGVGPKRVVLLLTGTGFDQEAYTIKPGTKILQIDNASGQDSPSFTVTTPGRDMHSTAPVRRGGRDEQMVAFSPGEWVVTEANHPEWVCRITVVP